MKESIHTFVVLAYNKSSYLEDCIKSVLNQKYNSKVIIVTSTPNDYIYSIAKKHNLIVVENKKHKNIGGDFDFALKSAKTKLITIAHQDDIYDYEYSYEMVNAFQHHNDSIIIFPNYYEIKNSKKIFDNLNLKIKRFLLRPLLNSEKSEKINNKRNVLKYGDAIGCPSVTFNTKKIIFPLFDCDFKCNVDWNAWEKLSIVKGKFLYINKFLMGHRIHEESTTTAIINDNIRTREDYEMYKRFWPKIIAILFTKIYKKSEKNNKIK